MNFLKQIVPDYGTDPLALIFLVTLLLLIYRWVNRKSAAPLIIILSVLLLIASPVLVNPLVYSLERLTKNSVNCAIDTPIVVLGAGLVSGEASALSKHSYQNLTNASLQRTLAAVELYRENSNVSFIISGGMPSKTGDAALMTDLMIDMGVLPDLITTDSMSANTHQNAINVQTILKTRNNNQSVTLITSAMHMWRSKHVFQKIGLSVCPHSADKRAIKVKPWAVAPQSGTLSKFNDLMHELIGIFYYKYKGWA